MSESIAITVIGSGYVGLVAAACFAEIGHRVICVDNNAAKAEMLLRGEVPIYEEHLGAMIAARRDTTLSFTTDLPGAVAKCDAIFIAVGTPQSSTGSADL